MSIKHCMKVIHLPVHDADLSSRSGQATEPVKLVSYTVTTVVMICWVITLKVNKSLTR